MKRIEFRELKMFDKLSLVKKAVMEGKNKDHIAMMLDECIYKTGAYMNGTTKEKALFTKEELTQKRKEKRDAMRLEGRHHRWNADDISTEARKRFEKSIGYAKNIQ